MPRIFFCAIIITSVGRIWSAVDTPISFDDPARFFKLFKWDIGEVLRCVLKGAIVDGITGHIFPTRDPIFTKTTVAVPDQHWSILGWELRIINLAKHR